MAALWYRTGHYIFVCGFFFLLFLIAYSQPLDNGRLPYFHTCCGLNAKCAPRGSLKILDAKKSPEICHLRTIAQLCWARSSQLRHVSTIGKKLVKQQYVLHMSSQYGERGPLTAEISSGVWDTPANLNEFHVLASLLHRRHSAEVSQTLHDVWPSLGLVQYIYIYNFRGLLPPNGILQGAEFILHPSLAFSYIGSVTARQSSSGCQPNFVAWYKGMELRIFRRGHHLHSAGRPSCRASAHILVDKVLW